MRRGIATWEEIGPIAGHVLLIVNSAPGDTKAVDQIFDMLIPRIHARDLFVVAEPSWQRDLVARGVRRSQILTAYDHSCGDLELNFFLQTRKAIKSLVRKRFAVVVGSAAHSSYNEEVKDIFEQRVAAFLGNGRFIAHALPNPYLYVLGVDDLVQRLGRDAKLRTYTATCRDLVRDLFAVWRREGSPASADDPAFDDVTGPLERRLGAEILAFDEVSPIRIQGVETGEPAAAAAGGGERTLAGRLRKWISLS